MGELNDFYVKIARIQGEFLWHTHADEDELFFVFKGELTIRLRDRDIHLTEGEFFIVPKGVEHMPQADKEAQILMLEAKTTVNTGEVENERTVEDVWL